MRKGVKQPIYDWVIKTYKTFIATEQSKFSMDLSWYIFNDNSFKSANCMMPIWKWKNKDTQKYEYIWLIDWKMYSNNYDELISLSKIIKEQSKTNLKKLGPEEKTNLSVSTISGSNMLFTPIGGVKPFTFEQMKFDRKPHLIEMLEKCKTKQLYPNKLGMTNKLGILLYGPPGTGKTACISAIANYMQRHILKINALDDFKLDKVLENIKSLQTTHIIVMDEIDYILCNEQKDEFKMLEIKERLKTCTTTEERSVILKEIKQFSSDDITRILLEYLDGMLDDTDRIIVATTNNPEKINPLFLRPGRFDLKLKMGYCSAAMFQDIVRTMYPDYSLDNDEISINSVSSLTTEEMGNESPIPKCVDVDKLLAKNITPTVLINTMVQTKSLSELMYQLDKLPFTEDKIALIS